jgi:hypothetical protein
MELIDEQDDNQAIASQLPYLPHDERISEAIVEAKIDAPERVEQAMADLYMHPGWKMVEAQMIKKSHELRNIPVTLDKESMAELGFRYAVASVAAEQLDAVVASVKRAYNVGIQKQQSVNNPQ